MRRNSRGVVGRHRRRQRRCHGAGNPSTAQATPTPTAGASTAAKNVIVLLKNQHAPFPRSRPCRQSAHRYGRRPGIGGIRCRKRGARTSSSSPTVNAFSATIAANQTTALQSDPAVAAVVPDLTLHAPDTSSVKAGSAAPTKSAQPTAAVCSTNAKKPQLEPEALQTMHVAYGDHRTGAQSYTDGSGVKVAWLADGVDINNPDFIRATARRCSPTTATSAPEGPNAPSSAAEAFGDASAIAAQGRQVYNVGDYVNPAHPLPNGCYITVRGVAPGATLYGLKVFGNANTAPTSRSSRPWTMRSTSTAST